MNPLKHLTVSLSFILFVLASCAHVISEQGREGALADVPFREVAANPPAFLGRTFVLGGIVVQTRNVKDGTEIEVIETPVDRYGSLINRDVSGGRFIVTTARYLDPLIYKQDRAITAAVVLTGLKTGVLDETEYSYPVFEAKEIYLWREEQYSACPPWYLYPYAPYPYGVCPWYPYPYFPYDPALPRPHWRHH